MLRAEMVDGLGEPSWDGLMQIKARLIWNHDGKCSCGRRTFLFGRCPKCIKEEAQGRLQEKLEEEVVIRHDVEILARQGRTEPVE